MSEWAKTGLAVLVLALSFLGGYFLSGKQIEWLQINAVESAHQLGTTLGQVEERVRLAEANSNNVFKEIEATLEEKRNLMDQISIDLEKQQGDVAEKANELVEIERQIGALQRRLTGTEGREAEERIVALNQLLSQQETAQLLAGLNDSVSRNTEHINKLLGATNLEARMNLICAAVNNIWDYGKAYRLNRGQTCAAVCSTSSEDNKRCAGVVMEHANEKHWAQTDCNHQVGDVYFEKKSKIFCCCS